MQYVCVALLGRWGFEDRGGLEKNESGVDWRERQSEERGESRRRREGGEGNVQMGETQEKEKKKKKDVKMKMKMTTKKSIWARAKFGFLITTSFRFTGTSNEVKNVPRFSSRDPDYIPSRQEFLRQKAAMAFTCYLVLDLFSLFSSDPAANATNYSAEMIPIFARVSQVSSQEVIRRLVTTFGAGFAAYCVQLGVQSVVAFVDVGLGMSEVQQWRPLLGSTREAYIVNRGPVPH